MARKEFPARVKAAALKRCMDDKGIPKCEAQIDITIDGMPISGKCRKELRAGDTFYDHIQPDGLGGEPTIENCMVLCGSCHGLKTFGADNPRMQKADHQRKRHFGIKARKGPPMAGTKASGIRKRMNGEVERR